MSVQEHLEAVSSEEEYNQWVVKVVKEGRHLSPRFGPLLGLVRLLGPCNSRFVNIVDGCVIHASCFIRLLFSVRRESLAH